MIAALGLFKEGIGNTRHSLKNRLSIGNIVMNKVDQNYAPKDVINLVG